MTDGPQATQHNPVVEALYSLDQLDKLEGEQEALVESDAQLWTNKEAAMFHAARAVAWSLLASVTGGQPINVRPRTEDDASPNQLEQQAKAAFGD